MTSLRAAVLVCMISVCLGCNPYKDPTTVELKSNLECDCGVKNAKNTRIVNGNDAAKHEFPWQVGLSINFVSNFFCGGSIISSKTILTAAHYFNAIADTTDIWAVIGEHNRAVFHDGEYWIKICNKTIHPKRDKTTKEYDFAILTLCTEIDFTTEISPICLPPMGSKADGSQFENVDAIVTGWGRLSTNGTHSDILQKTDVQTMTNNKCCTKPNLWACSQIQDSMMCGTWTGNNVSGLCNGDSGGPLITKETYGYSLIGVISYGSLPCATINVPDVYARVTKAKYWITENTKGSICKRPGLPDECKNYKILDESDRSMHSKTTSNKVDKTIVETGQEISVKWEGFGWYRFQTPAGTRMATSDPYWGNCGALQPIWMDSHHPTTVGTTSNLKFCHRVPWSFTSTPCWTAGKVTHCGDYYVYRLPDSPINGGRYCTDPTI